jgi:hypothetical protein
MERTQKDSESAIGALHCFPNIAPASNKKERAENCFRPMFQAPAGSFKDAKDDPGDDTEGGNGDNALAVALKESYERGVEKGSQDACDLAQQELAPSLQGFFNRLNTFSDSFKQFTQDQATQIVSLALSIAAKISGAGKISGRQQERNSDDMLPVKDALDAGLQSFQQLNLQLNKDDLKALADLIRCQNMEMNESGAVRIHQNDVIQRGAPQSSGPSATLEALREQITQTIENLD